MSGWDAPTGNWDAGDEPEAPGSDDQGYQQTQSTGAHRATRGESILRAGRRGLPGYDQSGGYDQPTAAYGQEPAPARRTTPARTARRLPRDRRISAAPSDPGRRPPSPTTGDRPARTPPTALRSKAPWPGPALTTRATERRPSASKIPAPARTSGPRPSALPSTAGKTSPRATRTRAPTRNRGSSRRATLRAVMPTRAT